MNGQKAKKFLETKGYHIEENRGLVHRYLLTYEFLLSSWYWVLQETDPVPLIGRTIEVYGFTVTNHPLDSYSIAEYLIELEI
jgi:hypothetical protein